MSRVSQINTSYGEQGAALQGQLGNLVDSRKLSMVQAEASASIPFGVMVKKAALGADGSLDQAKLLSAQADVPGGVVIHSHAYDPIEDLDDNDALVPKTVLSVLQEGEIWVPVEAGEVPAAGADVRYRAIAAGAEVAGAFRVTADAHDTVKLPHSKWRSARNADGLALLFLDLRAPTSD
jgi:hypothetical protein